MAEVTIRDVEVDVDDIDFDYAEKQYLGRDWISDGDLDDHIVTYVTTGHLDVELESYVEVHSIVDLNRAAKTIGEEFDLPATAVLKLVSQFATMHKELI